MNSSNSLSIALPPEILDQINKAVATGEYATSTEVIHEALRHWSDTRSGQQEDVPFLRKMWLEAVSDQSPGVPMDEVMDRLENRYRAMIRSGDTEPR